MAIEKHEIIVDEKELNDWIEKIYNSTVQAFKEKTKEYIESKFLPPQLIFIVLLPAFQCAISEMTDIINNFIDGIFTPAGEEKLKEVKEMFYKTTMELFDEIMNEKFKNHKE